MSELSLEAPLAFSEDDWSEYNEFQVSSLDQVNSHVDENVNNNNTKVAENEYNDLDKSFEESISDSLEDLVNTFDEKITNCFKNYDESIEQLAPVQIQAQEDVINDSPLWWTLTENFGNQLPVDWTKSYARKLQLPTLNLNDNTNGEPLSNHNGNDLVDVNADEEEIAKDLDLHSLIISSIHQEPIFTAEQVLEEIDEIMQEASQADTDFKCPLIEWTRSRNGIRSLMYNGKLNSLTTAQLNELYIDLEKMIQANSETLIQELALRDELEFEKELKNTFISLLLTIQNKQRQHLADKQKGKTKNQKEPKYLTTVIPYNSVNAPPDLRTLQILIKILKAVNEDSPTVPTLLTDFILKVLCPT